MISPIVPTGWMTCAKHAPAKSTKAPGPPAQEPVRAGSVPASQSIGARTTGSAHGGAHSDVTGVIVHDVGDHRSGQMALFSTAPSMEPRAAPGRDERTLSRMITVSVERTPGCVGSVPAARAESGDGLCPGDQHEIEPAGAHRRYTTPGIAADSVRSVRQSCCSMSMNTAAATPSPTA